MIYIGIDVAKDKHDCFITNSEGEVLFNAFTIPNNADGFHDLFQKISSLTNDFSNVKVGLEATGHYSYNLLGFLLDKGLTTYVINPLHTNLSNDHGTHAVTDTRNGKDWRMNFIHDGFNLIFDFFNLCIEFMNEFDGMFQFQRLCGQIWQGYRCYVS